MLFPTDCTDLNEKSNSTGTSLLPWLLPAAIVLLSGLIISLYAILIRQLTKQSSADECVKHAALYTARAMSRVCVDDPVFGLVGLCDVPGNVQDKPITSLNRLYATLRLDAMVADRLELSYMKTLVAADLERARKIENRLRQELAKCIVADDPHSDSVWNTAKRIAVKARQPDEIVTDFKLQLGINAPCSLTSSMPANCANGQQQWMQQGNYKTQVAVPIKDLKPVYFYQLAKEAAIVSDANFLPAAAETLPSVIQIQTTLKSTTKKEGSQADTMRAYSACAVVGGANCESPPSVLMIAFPHGMQPMVRKMKDLLNTPQWQPGMWQQATEGDVPGNGRLEQSSDMPQPIDSAKAIQTATYHWLRSLGPKLKVDAVALALDNDWYSAPLTNSASESAMSSTSVNSALVKDTGARSFAFLHQCGSGEPGQSALKEAFQATLNPARLPASALPLAVGKSGDCRLAGRQEFNRKLLVDFLASLYQTNMASLESAAVSQSIIERLNQAIAQTDRDIQLTTEELTSTQTRLARPAKSGTDHEITLLQHSHTELATTLEHLKKRQADYQQVRHRAEIVQLNANETAKSTYALCAGISRLATSGIFYCQAPHGFFLGKDLIFSPKQMAATEQEIYALDDAPLDNGYSWTDKSFSVIKSTTSDTTIERHKLSDLSHLQDTQAIAPRFILLTPKQLVDQTCRPVVLSRTPFGLSGISRDQLVFYAPNALTSGASPKVGWSVLVRDLSAYKQASTSTYASGDAPSNWFGDGSFAAQEKPLLGAEIQVRSPIPVLPDLPVGSYLVNPALEQRVSEIPPVPASML